MHDTRCHIFKYENRWLCKCFGVVTYILFLNKNTDDYVNHPIYDLHDVPNALFLNINIDDYGCDCHFCVHFFIPVINTIGVQGNTFTG